MHHVAVIYKRTRPEAAVLAGQIKDWLEDRQIEVFCHENIDSSSACCGADSLDIPRTVQAVVVLGGDGTLLSVARLLENRTTPIMGINLGGLGFLTEFSTETWSRDLQEILDGEYEIDKRLRLHVSVQREYKEVFSHRVLNDAVINKGALARIIDLKTTIDGRYLTRYRGDGLILATPTGSTAYNLSAGGPIVYPSARAVILTPICSFALTNRPIILPPEVTIRVELETPIQDVTLTCDGQVGCRLAPSDQIIISSAAIPLRLIKTPSLDYFDILRTKLKWGQN